MRILFVFISSIILDTFVQSDGPLSIICAYGGYNAGATYKLLVNEVPDRCGAVSYGGTNMNSPPNDQDAKAIQELKSAGKVVYMVILSADLCWVALSKASNATAFDEYISPSTTFLRDNKIDGIILSYLGVFGGKEANFANDVSSLISKFKACVPNIKVGLLVTGTVPSAMLDRTLFDFTVTNSVVDFYLIDTALVNACTSNTTTPNGGRLPITSKNGELVTLDQLCKCSADSGMDKNKIWGNFADMPTKDGNHIPTYSDYCHDHKSGVWCPDSMALLYDQVKYAKTYFKGIMISQLDTDDFDNSCACEKFSVANTYMDAWEDMPLKCCDKIDGI